MYGDSVSLYPCRTDDCSSARPVMSESVRCTNASEPKTELQKNAILAKTRKEWEEFRREEDMTWLNSRMADGRMSRCLARIALEERMEKDNQEKTDHAAIVNALAEKETALAREIENQKRLEIQELARRQLIRENDPGIKELTKKLRAGYICRDRRQQIANNEYRRLQEKIEDRYNETIMARSIYSEKEMEEKDMREEIERKATYKKELQLQLGNAQKQKQCKYEESLIEKKMLEQILKTMYDEDLKEIQLKEHKTNESRREMLTFQQARDAWRVKQRQLLIAEEKRFEKEEAEIQSRKESIAAEREKKMKEKEESSRRMAEKVLADEQARQERINMIKQLQEQEYLESNAQQDIAEKVKADEVRINCKLALTEQMNTKKRERERQRQADAAFRDEVLKKVAEDDAKEHAKQEKRKQMMSKYSKDLIKQIEDNKRRRESEKHDNDERNNNVWRFDAKWREEVQKEREKLIEEHAPHVLGYLQAGVLKKSDLPAVRKGANKHEQLACLNIEAMAETKTSNNIRPKCNAQCKIIREY